MSALKVMEGLNPSGTMPISVLLFNNRYLRKVRGEGGKTPEHVHTTVLRLGQGPTTKPSGRARAGTQLERAIRTKEANGGCTHCKFTSRVRADGMVPVSKLFCSVMLVRLVTADRDAGMEPVKAFPSRARSLQAAAAAAAEKAAGAATYHS